MEEWALPLKAEGESREMQAVPIGVGAARLARSEGSRVVGGKDRLWRGGVGFEEITEAVGIEAQAAGIDKAF